MSDTPLMATLSHLDRRSSGIETLERLIAERFEKPGFSPLLNEFGSFNPGAEGWKPNADSPEGIFEELERMADGIHGSPKEDNPFIPAAYTYLGQFLTHDISRATFLDPTVPDPAGAIENQRSPMLDLDSLYGWGPEISPELYSRAELGRLLTSRTATGELDLPRNTDSSMDGYYTRPHSIRRTAILGDARNDENVILGQLHLAFIQFHNRQLEATSRGSGIERFEQARQSTRWHYQWVVVYDLLKRICDDRVWQAVFDSSLPAIPTYRELNPDSVPGRRMPRIPVEFSFAAFRMGHSMVRNRYHLNDEQREKNSNNGIDGRPDLMIFTDRSPEKSLRWTLEGGRVLPPRWTVQWDRFLDNPDSKPQFSQKIGPSLSPFLRFLPIRAEHSRHRKLAYRTLLGGYWTGVVSGDVMRKKFSYPETVRGDVPLWTYVLNEAAATDIGKGERLGPVGSRIVAETIAGLLPDDPTSIFGEKGREFRPIAGSQGFGLREFLELSGAPVTRADWDQRLAGRG